MVCCSLKEIKLHEADEIIGLTVGLGEHQVNVSKEDLKKFNIVSLLNLHGELKLMDLVVVVCPPERQPAMFTMRQDINFTALRSSVPYSDFQTSGIWCK